jgi:cellobiose phosphorylase
VVTADVYAVEPHVGRGGWSWYTGSSGWMYRLLLESLLGLTRQADKLLLAPRLPAAWPGFTLRYRHGSSTYLLRVTRGAAPAGPTEIALVDDGNTYEIDIKV